MADDVTRTMSKGGGGACECLHPPPPFQEILYRRLDRAPPPQSFTLFRPLVGVMHQALRDSENMHVLLSRVVTPLMKYVGLLPHAVGLLSALIIVSGKSKDYFPQYVLRANGYELRS